MAMLPDISFGECSILPNDIDLSDGLLNTFGKHEIEKSAVVVVKFCQARGNWDGFTREEFSLWHYTSDLVITKVFVFDGLIKPGWDEPGDYGGYWLLDDGEKIFPTKSFVERCFERHPVQRIPME